MSRTSPVSESAKLADKIAAWSPSSNGPLVFIARERRLIEDALRSYAHAQPPLMSRDEIAAIVQSMCADHVYFDSQEYEIMGVGKMSYAAADKLLANSSTAGHALRSKEPIALINRRLEDLAEANAIYGNDQRLNAPDMVARNDREISWLKDLRSELVPSGHAQTPAVTDEMVERGWAGIVGRDVAAICHQASIIRADLKAGLVAALSDTSTDRPAGLIHPDVLMNVIQAKLNDYIELQSRGDLTELGDHAWLVLCELQRDMEFALSQSSPERGGK